MGEQEDRMKVVILAGGLGTRLKEETEFRPKTMVNIGSKPILWHIMKIYASYGITEFIICLGYKGDMIKKYFYNYEIYNSDFTIKLGEDKNIKLHDNHTETGWKVTLADTGINTLKGGRLKRIEKYIKSDVFMLTYGDGVSNVNMDKLLKFHKSHGKIATVTGVSPTARFGELKIQDNQVIKFKEKPENSSEFISGGFFVFNKEIFNYLTADEECDLEKGPLEKIAEEGQLMIYKHEGFWACMDTLRDTEYLNNLWNENKAQWKIWE